jgi:hypothetical protein
VAAPDPLPQRELKNLRREMDDPNAPPADEPVLPVLETATAPVEGAARTTIRKTDSAHSMSSKVRPIAAEHARQMTWCCTKKLCHV